ACACSGGVVAVANVNAPDQIVVSGERAAVESVAEAARAAGARRVIPLAVSVAAHSPLMADAQPDLRRALDAAAVRTPLVPFASAVTGRFHDDPVQIKSLLVEALTAPVRWTACVAALAT